MEIREKAEYVDGRNTEYAAVTIIKHTSAAGYFRHQKDLCGSGYAIGCAKRNGCVMVSTDYGYRDKIYLYH